MLIVFPIYRLPFQRCYAFLQELLLWLQNCLLWLPLGDVAVEAIEAVVVVVPIVEDDQNAHTVDDWDIK